MTPLPSVVKIGGSILGEGVSGSIVEDIRKVAGEQSLSLVHGGGEEVTQVAERLGKKQSFIVSPEGIRSRYTDRETVEIFTTVACRDENIDMGLTMSEIERVLKEFESNFLIKPVNNPYGSDAMYECTFDDRDIKDEICLLERDEKYAPLIKEMVACHMMEQYRKLVRQQMMQV